MIGRFIRTKEVVIYLWNILDVKCTHMGDIPKFGHIYFHYILLAVLKVISLVYQTLLYLHFFLVCYLATYCIVHVKLVVNSHLQISVKITSQILSQGVMFSKFPGGVCPQTQTPLPPDKLKQTECALHTVQLIPVLPLAKS